MNLHSNTKYALHTEAVEISITNKKKKKTIIYLHFDEP